MKLLKKVVISRDTYLLRNNIIRLLTWKEMYVNEVRSRVTQKDWERVHFLGTIPYEDYLRILQISSCHIYLTYPFVLSWSLLEAMSAECPIVASSTEPVREALCDKETGLLVDFFDQEAVAAACIDLLGDKDRARALGRNARLAAISAFDLSKICLPSQIAWFKELAGLA